MSNPIITTGPEIEAHGSVDFGYQPRPKPVRIYDTKSGGALQIIIGDLTLFITPDAWRAVNTTVEQHITAREATA